MQPQPVGYLVARIQQGLAEDARTNVLDLQVRIAGGKVFLMGEVESRERKQLVEDVVREVTPKDMVVVNELWLANYKNPPDVESVP